MNPPRSLKSTAPAASAPPVTPKATGRTVPARAVPARTEAPPLWQQLQACAAVLRAVRKGQTTQTALLAVAQSLRPGVQALSYTVLRHLAQAQALRSQLARKAPPAPVDDLLCSALALLLPGLPAGARGLYEPYTLVDQTVEAAKRQRECRAQATFLNACLRRCLREAPELLATLEKDPALAWNHPGWWIARLQADHPELWQAILAANNQPAPLTLRVNRLRLSREAYLAQLAAAGHIGRAVGEDGVQLEAPAPVPHLPGYAEGWFSVQDAAAQLAAPLLLDGLDLAQPLRVLDACAAPGGKTAHLLERLGHTPGHQVLALDVDAQRGQRIHENLTRLGLLDPARVRILAGDASQPARWWDGQAWDAILLDAPCTASGIVRRHPDVRWLRRPGDVEQLAALQSQLLDTLWPLLKRGGRLLYCTCSVFREEGQCRLETFLAHHTDARLRRAPGHLLPASGDRTAPLLDNALGDHDGFYYALLEKA